MAVDFVDLLREHHYAWPKLDGKQNAITDTESTTILAVRYQGGVVIAGDRRATAGTAILYDRADKVLEVDPYSVLAISGSPAMAFEIARVLEHSFKYYRRSQLQELSLEGKLRMLSNLIRNNLPMALQGIGAVIPIFASYDLDAVEEKAGKIFFYDALGAQFECADFATTGSGSVWIRGALYYVDRWEKRLDTMNLEESTGLVLRLLDAASEYDAATSGYNAKSKILPTMKTIAAEGIRTLDDAFLQEIYQRFVEDAHVG